MSKAVFETFFPTWTARSTYSIDFRSFYDEGYRGLIFDIDNTLVEHGAPADRRAMDFFDKIHSMGYKSVLLSNNKEPRVASFANQVNSLYIFKANKPSVKGYNRAMELMGTDVKNTLFVGDQLFTDVWGAKRSGIDTVLVGKIDKKEEIQIVLKRILERIVLVFYRKSPQYKELGDGNGN